MPFKLPSDLITYCWPVEIRVPRDGGRWKKETFEVEFLNISQSRMNELIEGSEDQTLGDSGLWLEVLRGWSGIVDDEDKEIPFTAENLQSVLDVPGVAQALITALMESRLGGQARKKT